MPDDLDPSAVFQLLQNLGIDRDAANVFHVAPGHGLPISNDGQSLHHRPCVLGWFLGIESVQEDANLGAALKTPTCGNRYQF